MRLLQVSLFLLAATLALATDLDVSETERHSSYSHVPQFESGGYGQGARYDAKDYLKKEFGDYAKDVFGGSSHFDDQEFLKHGQHRIDLKKQFSGYGDHHGLMKDFHEKGLFTRHRGIGYEKAWGWDKIKEVKDSGDKKRVHGASKEESSGLKKEEHKDYGKQGKEAHGEEKYQSAKEQKHFGQLQKEHESGGKSYENDFKFRREPAKYSQQQDGYQHGQGEIGGQGQGYVNPKNSGFGFETGFGDQSSLRVQGPTHGGYNDKSQSEGAYGTQGGYGDQGQIQGAYGGHQQHNQAGYGSQGQTQGAFEGRGKAYSQNGYGNQAGDSQGSYGNQKAYLIQNQDALRSQNQGGYGNYGQSQGGYGNYGQSQGGYSNEGQNQGGYGNEGQSQGGYGNEGQSQGGYGNEGQNQGGYRNEEGQSQGGYSNGEGQNQGGHKNQVQSQGDLYQQEQLQEGFGKRIKKKEPTKLPGNPRGRRQQRAKNQAEEVEESSEGVLYEVKPTEGIDDKVASESQSSAGEYEWIVKRNPAAYFKTSMNDEKYKDNYASFRGNGEDYASKLKYKRVSGTPAKESSEGQKDDQISRRADDEEVDNRRPNPIRRRFYGGNKRFTTRYSSGLNGFADAITKRMGGRFWNPKRKWSYPSSGNTVLPDH